MNLKQFFLDQSDQYFTISQNNTQLTDDSNQWFHFISLNTFDTQYSIIFDFITYSMSFQIPYYLSLFFNIFQFLAIYFSEILFLLRYFIFIRTVSYYDWLLLSKNNEEIFNISFRMLSHLHYFFIFLIHYAPFRNWCPSSSLFPYMCSVFKISTVLFVSFFIFFKPLSFRVASTMHLALCLFGFYLIVFFP